MEQTPTTLIHGLHHITAIAGVAQENLDFYSGVLGLRLVKKSVNQDDPGTYHLFYADAAGHPGSDLTFFPWADMPAGRLGAGLTVEVPFAVPAGSLAYWADRLERLGVATGAPTTRFGEAVLPFHDAHGLALALVETGDARAFTPWADSPVPPDQQIRGLHAARLWERRLDPTAHFLTEVFGLAQIGSDGGWVRFGVPGGGSGALVEIQAMPDAAMGQWGVGTVHHVAWRVSGPAEQLEMRRQVIAAGRHPTEVIDRFWFKSVYFREPGGVLFELATDGPGFALDENPAHLGEHLILPPWLEVQRAAIEAVLPPLTPPHLPAGVAGPAPE